MKWSIKGGGCQNINGKNPSISKKYGGWLFFRPFWKNTSCYNYSFKPSQRDDVFIEKFSRQGQKAIFPMSIAI